MATAGCAQANELGSSEAAINAASEADRSGWGVTLSDQELLGLTRTVIAGDIVEYRAEIRVGPGEHDRIGIHRVIRERSPWDPVRAPDGVMFVHGSASTFRSATAPALVAPDSFPSDFGLAPFLASRGIDVWGIDLRWTFASIEQTDFEMMRTWNLASHVEDLRVATEIARRVRSITGSGHGRLFFSGHSLGGDIIYAYANAETQLPPGHRDVRGLIPIEIVYKLVSPETAFLREQAAVRHQAFRAQYDAGQYAFGLGAQVAPLIQQGLTAPDELSPVVPGFTNFQAATAIFSMTHLFYAPLPPYAPGYHFNAGTFDSETGAPTGLEGLDAIDMLELALAFPPYQSMIEVVEIDALISDAVDVPYDDHLSEITVPVLHVGAAGGFGVYGAETLSLLGSNDTSSHIVQRLPAGAEALDYGHADLLWASDAEALVWQPILDWIVVH